MKTGISRGMEILMRHESDCWAEHDEIGAGGEPKDYTPEERAELLRSGWFVSHDHEEDEDFDCQDPNCPIILGEDDGDLHFKHFC